MKAMKVIVVLLLSSLGTISLSEGGMVKVSNDKQKKWLRRVMPLPKEISIPAAITLPAGDVGIKLLLNAGEIEKSAAGELKNLFKEKADADCKGSKFEILIGKCDKNGRVGSITISEAARLGKLPNWRQAYFICPVNDNTLILAALDERGVYYASKTLQQLLETEFAAGKVTIPLLTVTDWPDIEERGLWGFPHESIPWLASVKLNYGFMHGTRLKKIKKDQPNIITMNKDLYDEARLQAFNLVPAITHLNFLGRKGLYDAYPELAGVGDGAVAGRYFAHKQGDPHRVPCASNPLLTEILTEWMIGYADQGAREISCWLSERPAQCGCEKCLSVGQFVLEARAFVNAWRKTLRKYPDFRIRLFLSTTTNEKYHQILAECPAEVKIERCCAAESGRMPHLPRDLFVNQLFDDFASKGGWVASYDVPFTVNGAVESPEFKLPETSAHRVKDFTRQLINRKYSGAYGMTGWYNFAREICGFNYQALAEWSWNLNGRSTREFAEAWATREGFDRPDRFAKWSEIMGPIEFDVYDSDMPECYSHDRVANMIRDGQYPYLGEGMFRYYRTPESFDEKLKKCNKALRLTKSFKTPYYTLETRVVMSYVDLAKSVYEVALQNWREKNGKETKSEMDELLENLKRAGKNNTEAIKEWRSFLGKENWHARVHDAIKATEKTVENTIRAVKGDGNPAE